MRNHPRTATLVFALLLSSALPSAVARPAHATESRTETESSIVTSTFEVKGMTCGGCSAAVELRVGRLQGVRSVEASHEEGTAVVSYERDKVTPEKIVETIESLGYQARLSETETGEG